MGTVKFIFEKGQATEDKVKTNEERRVKLIFKRTERERKRDCGRPEEYRSRRKVVEKSIKYKQKKGKRQQNMN